MFRSNQLNFVPFKLCFAGLAKAVTCALTISSGAHAFDGWRLEGATPITGNGTGWDYVSLDAKANRLFIGHRSEGLQVIDIGTGKVIKVIGTTAADSSNGAVIIPEFDLGVSYNENGSVTPFALSTLKALSSIKLADELDSAHYDSWSKRLVVNMASGKDGTELLVLEVPSLKIAGSIKVTTKKPEHAEADGSGNFYLTARDENKVYRIDTKAMKVTAEWPTPGCTNTNGLALDAANRRIFLGCRGDARVKPSFVVMNADTGAIIFTDEIGGGNDGVIFDAGLKRVFLANGVNAVLNVYEQVNADSYRQIEALGTRAGVRTMAMHPVTKKIYAVTAEGSADYAKKVTTSVSPYYANTFFADTFVVLTYAKR